MRFEKLGDYIKQVDVRNSDLKFDLVKGISNLKLFIDTKANMDGVPLHNYKLVKNNQFAYVSVTSRNGGKLSIAINRTNDVYLVSSTYIVFETNEKLLPEFLYIYFNRPEFDRYARYNSWGSARETFSWEDLCEIEIPIIPIEEQKKYVSIYNSLLKNQACYENSLDDLQLICDSYIDNLIKTEEPKRLGDYIEKTEFKNTDNAIKDVMGMSVSKEFRTPSVKVNMNNLSNYRIVNYNEFGYVQTTNNEKVLIVCLSKFKHPIIISSIHIVFKIKENIVLLPEYLHLFLKRKEMDRYARFHSWGSARETFNWDDMCNVMLPIPDIEKQQAIVTIYHTLATRKKLNEKLKESLQPLCPILMKGVRNMVERGGK